MDTRRNGEGHKRENSKQTDGFRVPTQFSNFAPIKLYRIWYNNSTPHPRHSHLEETNKISLISPLIPLNCPQRFPSLLLPTCSPWGPHSGLFTPFPSLGQLESAIRIENLPVKIFVFVLLDENEIGFATQTLTLNVIFFISVFLVFLNLLRLPLSMIFLIWILNIIWVLPALGQYNSDCGRKDYDKCVRLADPLLTDPHLIFPDNMGDIDHVCRTWSKFVDCIKSYIDRCFTETRRNQFNKAVESPVDSVHQMCTSSSYQQEYMQHATCLKSTLTEDIHCGRHYKQLVAQVQGPKEMGRADLCCSHHRFRECVLTETRRICDVKLKVTSKMLASAFSRQILDKALSFLREQCSTYIPNLGECPGYQSPNRQEDNYIKPIPKIQPTQPVENRYPADQVFSDNFQPTVAEQATMNPQSWIPSSRDGRRKTTKTTDYDFQSDLKTTSSVEDASSRSSYGRGISLDSTESSTKEDIFKATHYKPSTESWYPGNNINFYNPEKEINDFQSNQVDEPNQQGLSRFGSDSGSGPITLSFPCLFMFLVALLQLP